MVCIPATYIYPYQSSASGVCQSTQPGRSCGSCGIYAARETDTLGISSEDLQKRIQELGTPCEYFPTFDEIENYLLSNCQEGDLLITMGAGDVVNIGEHLLGK